MSEEYLNYPYQQQYQNNSAEESSLVKQTNPNAVLLDIEMTLRGKKWDDDEKKFVRPIGCEALLNELGINSLMADARGIINQNTIMSNLNKEEISKMLIQLGDTITNKLEINWKEFAISKSNLSTCVDTILYAAKAALNRALGEGEKRFLKTSVRAIESYNTHSKGSNEVLGSPTAEKLKFWR